MQKNSYNHPLMQAIMVYVYVIVVASCMYYAGQLLDPAPQVMGMMAFLMLFVLSAAVVGWLIFGRPLLLYLDGKKKESFAYFRDVMFGLFGCTVLAFALVMLMS